MVKRRPNIVMVSIDTLRFDCVGYQPCTTYLGRFGIQKRPFTPTLDKLAEEAVRFTDAVSTASYTTSSHATILTGLEPPMHGVRAFFGTQLLASVPTLPELLRAAGYYCVLATDLVELFEPIGLTRGFDRVVVADDELLFAELDKAPRPVFVLVHVFDVHAPYLWSEEPRWQDEARFNRLLSDLAEQLGISGPTALKTRRWRDLIARAPRSQAPPSLFLPVYLQGVWWFDQGRFSSLVTSLERLGLVGNGSCVFVFSDHGEGDYYGHLAHGGPLIDEVIRVPLILHAPDYVPPQTIHTQVSLTCLAATALELAQISAPNELSVFAAPSLIPGARGDWAALPRVAYAEYWAGSRNLDTHDLRSGNTNGISWHLAERVARISGYKLRVRGAPETLLSDIPLADVGTDDFVTGLYRGVLGREPDSRGFTGHVTAIQQGTCTRAEALRSMAVSEEFSRARHFLAYDLARSPFEDVESQSMGQPPPSWLDCLLWGEIQRRSCVGQDGPPIAFNDRHGSYSGGDEAIVTRRLQDLGYLDAE